MLSREAPVTEERQLGWSAIYNAPRRAKIRASLYSMMIGSGITISQPVRAEMRSTRNLLNAPPPVMSKRLPGDVTRET